MTEERIKYLTFVKNDDFDVKNVTMSEMLFWSKHNVFNYANIISILALKKSRETDKNYENERKKLKKE